MYGLLQTRPNDAHRPLVDFDLALTFIPALLLGVSFGVSRTCWHCGADWTFAPNQMQTRLSGKFMQHSCNTSAL